MPVGQAISAKWSKGSSGPAGDEHHNLIAHSLRAEGFDASEDGTGRGTPIVPIDMRQASRGDKLTDNRATGSGGPPGHGVGNEGDPAFTVSERGQAIAIPIDLRNATCDDASMAVRRLTPIECERLQGFPDDYTAILYRNKPAADGPRYKALGNSMAVPVMAWIGKRIAFVNNLQAERQSA